MPDMRRMVRVALDVPLRHGFDYLVPDGMGVPVIGSRVRVPFGRRNAVGVVIARPKTSEVPEARLKPVRELLDSQAAIGPEVMKLCRFAAQYYHHPLGEVLSTAMPLKLRQGAAPDALVRSWHLTREGAEQDLDALKRRAPRQAELIRLLLATGEVSEPLPARLKRLVPTLEKRAWLLCEQRVVTPVPPAQAASPGPELSREQATAVRTITSALGRFAGFLLRGVTGSGKTEVYLQSARACLAAGRRVLILVPEISLTPQLVERVRTRLGARVALSHSGLTDSERLAHWRSAKDGAADVVLGTRSAVFAPVPDLGLIIVDEEHDASFKQQDGFRYSARDMALVRARDEAVPIVLGSATPSFEALHQVEESRLDALRLPRRVGVAKPPSARLVDLRQGRLEAGVTTILLDRMRSHLIAGGQVLLFINRRGFAPCLLCESCGWRAECSRCDAALTLHRSAGRMHCHHCDHRASIPLQCPECDAHTLAAVGQGTQRIEETLTRRLPGVAIARLDRDSTRSRGSLERTLDSARRGETKVLIGTQMLAKGHHLPGVTLAAVLDADQGLFGLDFRAQERLAQIITQVAGRSGRGEQAGEVIVQTRFPDHPTLRRLITEGYDAVAADLMEVRRSDGWPPFERLVLFRAEASDAKDALAVLRLARAELESAGIEILGPAPAPMARRAGRHRAQLLLIGSRGRLQTLLRSRLEAVLSLPAAQRARLSIDVDPIELF
jgi:primosomal protein N' (replication factor Y) (superfamily II helicase)